MVFGYGSLGGYASVTAFQHISSREDSAFAQIGEINGILFTFPLARVPITQSPHNLFPCRGPYPHLHCEIGKSGSALCDLLFIPLRSIVQFRGNG